MSRLSIVRGIPFALALLSIGCQLKTQNPNVILIVTDDQGWVDLGS